MRLPIRWKLALSVGVPLLVVYLAALGIDYHAGKAEALANMREHLTELASHHAATLDGKLAVAAQIANDTATFLSTRPDASEKQLYDLLRANLEANPGIYGAAIAFEPGAFEPGRQFFAPYVCRGKDGLQSMDIAADSYDYALWDWYLIPKLLEHGFWTEPYFDEGAGNILMCTYSAPFWRGGKLRGITTIDVSLAKLGESARAKRMPGGYCTILSKHGRVITHPDPALVMRETIFSIAEWYGMPELAELGREAIAGKHGVKRVPDYKTKRPKWIVTAPIPSCGWTFAAVIPEERVLAPVYANLRRDMTIMLAGLGLILGLVVLSALRITAPIARLARTVGQLASGDLDAQVTQITTRDEIGDLAQAFNKMVADLKGHIAALTRETAARESAESELRVARSIQASLMPRTFPPFPDRREFDLHAVNSPAKQVAGDFFDFFFISDNELVVVMADVSGKGVPAALFMAVARTVIKNFAMSDLGPGQVLERANDMLAEDNEETMFVTLFLGIYHTDTGRLVFANAGHNPPYRVGREGQVLPFGRGMGVILGAFPGQQYEEAEIRLGVGEMLVFYTDGVTEAQKVDDREMFGEQRFEALLGQHAADPVEQVCDVVIQAVDDFQAHTQYDDVTLLVLRRNQPNEAGEQ